MSEAIGDRWHNEIGLCLCNIHRLCSSDRRNWIEFFYSSCCVPYTRSVVVRSSARLVQHTQKMLLYNICIAQSSIVTCFLVCWDIEWQFCHNFSRDTASERIFKIHWELTKWFIELVHHFFWDTVYFSDFKHFYPFRRYSPSKSEVVRIHVKFCILNF